MSTTQIAVSCFKAACKLRWVQKQDTDQMTISNSEGLKQMTAAVMAESAGDYAGGAAAQVTAKEIMDHELEQYLLGIKHTAPTVDDAWQGMNELGEEIW